MKNKSIINKFPGALPLLYIVELNYYSHYLYFSSIVYILW